MLACWLRIIARLCAVAHHIPLWWVHQWYTGYLSWWYFQIKVLFLFGGSHFCFQWIVHLLFFFSSQLSGGKWQSSNWKFHNLICFHNNELTNRKKLLMNIDIIRCTLVVTNGCSFNGIYCVFNSHKHCLETSELRQNICIQGLHRPVWLRSGWITQNELVIRK